MQNGLILIFERIQTNAKLATDATYGENYKEILAWLQNAENCLKEAQSIACELRDAK